MRLSRRGPSDGAVSAIFFTGLVFVASGMIPGDGAFEGRLEAGFVDFVSALLGFDFVVFAAGCSSNGRVSLRVRLYNGGSSESQNGDR